MLFEHKDISTEGILQKWMECSIPGLDPSLHKIVL